MLPHESLAEISPETLNDALRAMFDLSPTPFCVSTTSRPHTRYVKVNSAYLELIGRTWEEIEGTSLVTSGAAIPGDGRDRRLHLLDTVGFFKLEEAEIRHSSGRLIPVLISAQRLRLGRGQAVDVEIITDISERKAFEREIMRVAFTDAVTGLPNRSCFDKDIETAIATRQPEESVGLAYFDLNGFKKVNDRNGHAAGDALLGTIGRRLMVQCFPAETVARIGGDEFAMLFKVPHKRVVSDARFRAIAESLCFGVELGAAADGFGVAVGVAIVDRPRDSDSLRRYADNLMYEAKSTQQRVALRMSRFRN